MFEKWKIRRTQPETDAEPTPTLLAMIARGPDAAALSEILRGSGWALSVAESLEEAAGLLAAEPACIVLLDRDLPEVDWRQAVRRLANDHSRVILASFVADDYLWEEVIHCGGYDVIAKPFREDEVIHMIQFAWAALTKSLPSAPRTK